MPIERQEGVIALRGGVRYIKLDLAGSILFDGSNDGGRGDPIIEDYRRRLTA